MKEKSFVFSVFGLFSKKVTEVGREIFSLLKIKKSSTEYLNELAEKI